MSDGTTLPWRNADIDPERLCRAIGYNVAPDPGKHGVYNVWSGAGDSSYWVNLRDIDCPLCDCHDHVAREVLCKHAIAALLYEGDPRVLLRVGQLVREGFLARRLLLALTRLPLTVPGGKTSSPTDRVGEVKD